MLDQGHISDRTGLLCPISQYILTYIISIAALFAQAIDSLAAGGLLVADIWIGKRIFVIDKLGAKLLEIVQDGDWIKIDQDGTVVINNT